MSLPLVSVVVTSYNQKESLERAVNSVLDQTYQNIQIVIADDYSTDASRCYLEKLKDQFPDKVKLVFQKKNVGIPKNKNAGFKACEGDFITYLDGDDFYYPEKIEREVKIFLEQPQLDIVYSNFQYVAMDSRMLWTWADQTWSPQEGYIFPLVFCRKFPRNTLYRCELMKKDVLEKIGYLDEDRIAYEDGTQE
jgi:glycosyltransferase involved in cell wall biosynthesis